MVWRGSARAPDLSERQWRTSREDRRGSDLERAVVRPGEYQRQSRRRRQGLLLYLDNQHGDFSYSDLSTVKAERRKSDPEYELLDTGILKADRYLDAVVQYAKAIPKWFAACDPARHAVALSTVEVVI
jgi:hypothetical protein